MVRTLSVIDSELRATVRARDKSLVCIHEAQDVVLAATMHVRDLLDERNRVSEPPR